MSVQYTWPNKHYIQYIGMEYSPSLGPEPYSTSRLSCSPWLILHACFTFRSPFCASRIHPPPFHKFIALHPRHLCARSRDPRNDSVKFTSSTSPRGSVASRTSFAFLFFLLPSTHPTRRILALDSHVLKPPRLVSSKGGKYSPTFPFSFRSRVFPSSFLHLLRFPFTHSRAFGITAFFSLSLLSEITC